MLALSGAISYQRDPTLAPLSRRQTLAVASTNKRIWCSRWASPQRDSLHKKSSLKNHWPHNRVKNNKGSTTNFTWKMLRKRLIWWSLRRRINKHLLHTLGSLSSKMRRIRRNLGFRTTIRRRRLKHLCLLVQRYQERINLNIRRVTVFWTMALIEVWMEANKSWFKLWLWGRGRASMHNLLSRASLSTPKCHLHFNHKLPGHLKWHRVRLVLPKKW